MGNYRALVFSNAVAGREKEFNDWYNDVHLRDVIACTGVAGAQRFNVKSSDGQPPTHKFLAIYELEEEADPYETFELIGKRAGTDAMKLSEALDANTVVVHFVEPITGYRKE